MAVKRKILSYVYCKQPSHKKTQNKTAQKTQNVN